MNVIYIDQSAFHQQGLASLINELNIHCCSDIRDIDNILSQTEMFFQPPLFVIFDFPAHFLTALTCAERLAELKRKFGVKLILFSDKNKKPFNFNKNSMHVDFFVDKKLPPAIILSLINRIIKNETKTPRPFAIHAQNELNENEIIFLRCLFTKGSIDGVARVTRKKPKALYSYQANLVKKLNLKNTLHLYQSFILN
ncbi:DNA-binding NarL/FixJ family response regulator [Rahnella sp. BIGb0603]|jgi:DNA-binding NarL/FixJ family response regulator|uniref:LuxR family transcriptional regulator n=1 Tax=Rahnella TaxID=34037 RepID=UPI002167E28A|nr:MULTISPECIES: LuxR family transcriptional regulator [Rahnella]MCS3424288.1 DNA-binding NarL/FixJ family response regulator [Rahnella sp. BIGb0603]MDF1895153.1 LuxR family transcriptional regulator [Rahnella contaminans]